MLLDGKSVLAVSVNLVRVAHIDAALLIIIKLVLVAWLPIDCFYRDDDDAYMFNALVPFAAFFSPSSLSILVPSPPKKEVPFLYYWHNSSILNSDDSDEATKFNTVNPHNEDEFHWWRSKVPLPQSSEVKVTSVELILFLLVKWQYVLLISYCQDWNYFNLFWFVQCWRG